MAKAEEVGSEDAKAKAQEAIDAANASYAAIEEKNFEEALTQSDIARDYAKEANDLSKEAEKSGETKTDGPKAEDNNQTDDTKTESNGVSPIVWVIIVIVVIAVIVVIVVVTKKKK